MAVLVDRAVIQLDGGVIVDRQPVGAVHAVLGSFVKPVTGDTAWRSNLFSGLCPPGYGQAAGVPDVPAR